MRTVDHDSPPTVPKGKTGGGRVEGGGSEGQGRGGKEGKKNFLASNTVALALSRILSL